VIKKLQDITHKKVSAAYFDVTPPFNLQFGNLNIENTLKAKRVYLSISLPYLILGRVAFNNVVMEKPEFVYVRSPQPEAAAIPAAVSQPEVTGNNTASGRVSPKRPYLIIKQLTIKGGKINFLDQTVNRQGLKLIIKDIDFRLTNFYPLPFSAVTGFDLKARIPWQAGKEEGKIEAEGWLNYYKKNMEAVLKIDGIDGIYLYPYYSNWVDLDKARIESARLSFTSNIQGISNNVAAECHLELTDIVRRPRAEDEPEQKAAKITDKVLDIFKALNQGKIVLDFTIKTKMTRPEFGFGNIKMAFENKLNKAVGGTTMGPQDVFLLPAKIWEKAVEIGTATSKAVFGGVVAVGKEIKKTVEGTPKNEPGQK